jgi:hypothetical protein
MAKNQYEIYVQTEEVIRDGDSAHATHNLKSIEVLPALSNQRAFGVCKALVEYFDTLMTRGHIGKGAEAEGKYNTKVTAIGTTEQGDAVNTVFELSSTDFTVDAGNRLEIVGTHPQIDERIVAVRAVVAYALSPSGNAIAPQQ